MKTDRYTKTVLTIIAIALCAIAVKQLDMVPKAHATNTSGYRMVPLNEDGTITVRLASPGETMDVNIREVGGSSVSGELPVNVEEINGSSISGSEMPVDLKEIGGSSTYGPEIDVNIKEVAGSSVYRAVPVELER